MARKSIQVLKGNSLSTRKWTSCEPSSRANLSKNWASSCYEQIGNHVQSIMSKISQNSNLHTVLAVCHSKEPVTRQLRAKTRRKRREFCALAMGLFLRQTKTKMGLCLQLTRSPAHEQKAQFLCLCISDVIERRPICAETSGEAGRLQAIIGFNSLDFSWTPNVTVLDLSRQMWEKFDKDCCSWSSVFGQRVCAQSPPQKSNQRNVVHIHRTKVAWWTGKRWIHCCRGAQDFSRVKSGISCSYLRAQAWHLENIQGVAAILLWLYWFYFRESPGISPFRYIPIPQVQKPLSADVVNNILAELDVNKD